MLMCIGVALFWCLCALRFCTNYHYNNLPGFKLQRWVGGLVCFFLHTSSSCNCPRKPFAVTRRLRRALFRRVRRTPGRALCSRFRLHLARASCRHRFFAFWLLFHRSHTRDTASSCTVCCLVCKSVYFCSRTALSSELPHLLPPCGARCALVQGDWCWLETSSHVLFG